MSPGNQVGIHNPLPSICNSPVGTEPSAAVNMALYHYVQGKWVCPLQSLLILVHFNIGAFNGFPQETTPIILTVYLGFWKNLFKSCLPITIPLAAGLLRKTFCLYIFISEENLCARHLFSMWFPDRDTHKEEGYKID